jgi:hypothetical protein
MSLRALTLSAFFALSSASCQINKQYVVPPSQLEQNIDGIVADGIDFFKEGKIQEARALLEAYKAKDPNGFTAPAHTLLALCYVDSINLSNIKKVSEDIRNEFQGLNDNFVEEPEILFEVQEQFEELFKTEGYKRIEEKIQSGIKYEPALYGALFLLHLAQRKYELASKYAKKFIGMEKFKSLPNPKEIIDEYKMILSELSGRGSERNDYNIMVGCARVAEAFLPEEKK